MPRKNKTLATNAARRDAVPLAQTNTLKRSTPKMNQQKELTVTHTEYIPQFNTNTIGSVLLTTDTMDWLQTVASAFEEYQISFTLNYHPTCPATTSGSTFLLFDYDPEDDQDTNNLAEYMATQDAWVGPVWQPHQIKPRPSGWLKTGSTGDARFYSPGIIKYYGNSNDGMGYLSITYTVKLRKAQFPELSWNNHGVITGANAPWSGLQFLPHGFEVLGGALHQTRPGKYLVVWRGVGGSLTAFNDIAAGDGADFVAATPGTKCIVFEFNAIDAYASFTATGTSSGSVSSVTIVRLSKGL